MFYKNCKVVIKKHIFSIGIHKLYIRRWQSYVFLILNLHALFIINQIEQKYVKCMINDLQSIEREELNEFLK